MANKRVKKMRDMLALATCLRQHAGQTTDAKYMGLMIRAALELEARASFLANTRPDESEDGVRHIALYDPVDKNI